MSEQVVYKTPTTTIPLFDLNFTDDLPGDTAIHATNSTVTAQNSEGQDVSSALIANTTRSGMVLSADLQGGDNGEDYRVSFKAVGNTSAKPYERVIELRVRTNLIGQM